MLSLPALVVALSLGQWSGNLGVCPSGQCVIGLTDPNGPPFCGPCGGGGGASSVGSAGTVQQSNGAGAFQAYTGSGNCAGANTYVKSLDATGAATCETATVGASHGVTGVLQTTDGSGGFSQYGGSVTCPAGQFVTNISINGAVLCAADPNVPSFPLSGSRGGLGAVQPNCPVGQVLTCNYIICTCTDSIAKAQTLIGNLTAPPDLGNRTDWNGVDQTFAAGTKVTGHVNPGSTATYDQLVVQLFADYPSAKGKAFVYAEGVPLSASTLVQVSQERVGLSGGVIAFTFSPPLSLAAGSYFVGIISDTALDIRFGQALGAVYYNADSYATGPSSTWGAGWSSGNTSPLIYLHSTVASPYPVIDAPSSSPSILSLRVGGVEKAYVDAAGTYHGPGSGGGGSSTLLVYTLATRPTPSAPVMGLQIVLRDAGYQGGADVVQTCLLQNGGTYKWVDTAMAP